jgi:hypothetical protein
VSAQGVILENTLSMLHRTRRRLVVGVKFDDGETVEFAEEIMDFYVPPAPGPVGRLKALGGEGMVSLSLNTGEQIPVRYDPDDRTKLAIDEPALHEGAVSRNEEAATARRAAAEAILEKSNVRATQAEQGHARPRAGDDVDRDARLEELAYLHDSGLLSDADFEIETAKIRDES